MTLRTTIRACAITIVLTLFLVGCLLPSNHDIRRNSSHKLPVEFAPQPNTIIVYFFRDSSYKGLGRIHELKIDDNLIGTLTSDNYFRIELWPGDYQFSIYLPAEIFFGSHSPPENTIMRLSFGKSGDFGVYVYKYIDGEGIHRVEPVDDDVIAEIENKRILSFSLSARDTAQVKFLHDARYDGPASSGKAHGHGTLTWEDGSILRGRFEYGETTEEGEFLTTKGQIYLGPKRKGRPIGPGVWMNFDRQILYAGPFKDELPHGIGIRSGNETPEFCVYENGEDITKTIFQLAEEAVEQEDRIAEEEKPREVASEEDISTKEITDAPGEEEDSAVITPKNTSPSTSNQPTTTFSIPIPKKPGDTGTPKNQPDITDPIPTRDERVSNKYKIIKRRIEQQLEEKRLWCQEEFAMGRQLCTCAPFATQFDQWKGCIDR